MTDRGNGFSTIATLARGALSFGSGLADELFPATIDHAVAEAQAAGWRIDPPEQYCARCGASVGPGEAGDRGCSACVKTRPWWRGVVRLSAYEPPMADWIVHMKFHRAWPWAKWFGARLAELPRVRETIEPRRERTVVCPVPMHLYRRWARGYNQAKLQAEAFARGLGLPMSPLLRRTEHGPPQTDVAVSDRAANVRGAYAARPIDLAGWNVWLIDDVKTTGSTLSVCARLLREAGAENIHVAVAAVADPKKHA